MNNNKIINIVASTTLTIYLLHDHADSRHFLWIALFKNAAFIPSTALIPYSIGVILLVFIVGVLVGLIYKYSIGLGGNYLLDIFGRKCL